MGARDISLVYEKQNLMSSNLFTLCLQNKNLSLKQCYEDMRIRRYKYKSFIYSKAILISILYYLPIPYPQTLFIFNPFKIPFDFIPNKITYFISLDFWIWR